MAAPRTAGDVLGVLAVQSPVDLVGDRLQGMFSSMVFDSSVLFLLLDDAYWPTPATTLSLLRTAAGCTPP